MILVTLKTFLEKQSFQYWTEIWNFFTIFFFLIPLHIIMLILPPGIPPLSSFPQFVSGAYAYRQKGREMEVVRGLFFCLFGGNGN